MDISQQTAEKIHANLVKANQLKTQGRVSEAEAICHEMVKLCPDYPDTYQVLGIICFDTKRFRQAADNLARAVKDFPEQPFVWMRLGQCWLELKDAGRAKEAFEKALSYAPDVGETHYWLAQQRLAAGKTGDAITSLEEAIQLDPKLGQAYRSLAGIADEKNIPSLVEKIEGLLSAGNGLDTLVRSNLVFALGRFQDRLGCPAFGFDYYLAGKTIQDNPFQNWAAAYQELFDNSRKVFTREFLKEKGVPQKEKKFTPIFIVGVPRSGTTLVEQILASHGKVCGADEVPFIQGVVQDLEQMTAGTPYPQSLADLAPEKMKELANSYQVNMQALAPDAPFITDKMLANCHVLGFIKMLFPWAKIINVARDPQDTCLSIMKNQFQVRLAPYLRTPADIGTYYAMYLDIMDFWKSLMADDILDVKYEDLVQDFEPGVKKILKFCGLKFEKDCLDFHKTVRPVHSLSTTQVKKPLYTSSISAARAFATQLAPFRDALTGKYMGEPTDKIKERIQQAASFLADNNPERAEKIAMQVLETNPGQADALQILGHIKSLGQRHDEAITFFTQSLQSVPDQPSVWVALGDALNLVRRTDEAEHAFKMALAYDPGNTDAWLWLGAGALGRNDPDAAISCLQRALAIDPMKGAPYALMAKIKQFQPDEAFMTALEGAAGENARSPDDRAHALYALAGFARRGNDKDAFVRHLDTANNIQNQIAPLFDVAGEDLVKKTRQEITPATLKKAAKPGFMKTTPIFIVGLPRSGSSLTEQILSRHKKVFAGDELLFMYSHIIGNIEEKTGLAYPEGLGAFTSKDWENIGKAYHERVSSLSGGAPFVTDKMLTNICYAGLARLALPGAKVIYMKRNLMDTALSIHSNYFTERLYYCCNLKRLGAYARRVHEFACFWRQLDPDFMLDVNYEDLVQNQKAETRRILEYCGLEWDPACLDFHKAQRQVYTHSMAQVSQPMYASSIGKWKDYADMLEPFRLEVRDLIDEEGFLKG